MLRHLRSAANTARRRFILNGPVPANRIRNSWQSKFRSAPKMALDLLRSGYATLTHEMAEERASALARLGRRLEAALTALAACPRTADGDRKTRDGLVAQA